MNKFLYFSLRNIACIDQICNRACLFYIISLENKLTTTGVAIIASLSTMLTISLFVILYMSRHIMKNKTNRHRTDASVPENEKASKTYVDLSAMDEKNAYSTLGCTVSDTPYNVII